MRATRSIGMGDKPTVDQEVLLQKLKAAATAGQQSEPYRTATVEAKPLLAALETSRVLDRETLKRPVNI